MRLHKSTEVSGVPTFAIPIRGLPLPLMPLSLLIGIHAVHAGSMLVLLLSLLLLL